MIVLVSGKELRFLSKEMEDSLICLLLYYFKGAFVRTETRERTRSEKVLVSDFTGRKKNEKTHPKELREKESPVCCSY